MDDIDLVADRLSWHDDDIVIEIEDPKGLMVLQRFHVEAESSDGVLFTINALNGRVVRPFKTSDGVLFTP